MAPLIPSAKSTLSYPLYACDFDPIDSSRLVVGGGGGAGRTGVGNKITLLDTSNPNELVEAAEIDLSKEEDNVTSLAVGQPQGKTSLIYAGVNSSPEEFGKGNNAHFRVIGIEPVAKGKGKNTQPVATTSKLSEISRISLFTHVERDLYQRVIRLSRSYPGQSQWGAVATGLAKDSEVVLFKTARTGPPKSKGAIKLAKEAVDMDFIQTGKDDYLFAYADEYDIYVKKLGSMDDGAESECVYITPASRGKEKVTLPSFRSIRWLTKDFIVMLTNIHSQGGVVLQILRLPPSGKGQCRIAQSHRLPSSITKATGLAVSNLTPPVTPDEEQGYTQFVIAVAGHDISISLFKVDLQHELNNYLVTPIKPFRTFKNVHPLQITGITFSNFTPPTGPVTASTPPQYLKLASVGVSNTVIVHTLPLFPVPLSVKRGQSHTPRYVVALPSSKAIYSFGIILSMLVAVFAAIMMQSILEIRGVVEPHLGAANYLPIPLQEAIGKPYIFPSHYNALGTQASTSSIPPSSSDTSPSPSSPDFFASLRSPVPNSPPSRIYLHHGPPIPDIPAAVENQEKKITSPDTSPLIHAVLHDADKHTGKSWDELTAPQKESWKRKLKDAGHWVEGMGEAIFKGVVFGELRDLVGAAVVQAAAV
ncbi:hypothetical protein SS1G_00636 [Sclerotinia sclerotiorum 1980 UF-70]|uniref:Guanine nucleotide-exchange factor SEC12 n=2 Tax=Sclerotinia sclerotiorum (strain ATCC 18683 / 1980 / Ss-1) TaxID=665079 RepID=A7E5R1_SCLS1|nr:hypothetical protein SS1G_00636 [Sclerotinia sclerotiorum 1980 UF-70]APA07776.1 hypothetical protein sscle_03g025460 [Sclerotinia sclerotiorum 1980 UF-70]EDN91233.1 hypothetical protein SS1G_00636 [Sclerotinia sclerotiorum 1980 UF-70]